MPAPPEHPLATHQTISHYHKEGTLRPGPARSPTEGDLNSRRENLLRSRLTAVFNMYGHERRCYIVIRFEFSGYFAGSRLSHGRREFSTIRPPSRNAPYVGWLQNVPLTNKTDCLKSTGKSYLFPPQSRTALMNRKALGLV